MIDTLPERETLLVATHGQPVLQRLREATGQSHKSLEDRLPFMLAELDRGLYVRLIQAYYGFYQPLERVIAELPADSPTAHQRFKVPALIRDLTALGMSREQIDALPLCVALPSLRSPHRLLGTRYVIEGATLGGQVLRRVIKDKLGIEADCGAEFLDVYGRSTGPLWKAFLTDLAQADDPAHNDQVVHAACETFRCFEQWLDNAKVLSA